MQGHITHTRKDTSHAELAFIANGSHRGEPGAAHRDVLRRHQVQTVLGCKRRRGENSSQLIEAWFVL